MGRRCILRSRLKEDEEPGIWFMQTIVQRIKELCCTHGIQTKNQAKA